MLRKPLRGTKHKQDEGESPSPTDWAFLRLGGILAEIAINKAKKSVAPESLTVSDGNGGMIDDKHL